MERQKNIRSNPPDEYKKSQLGNAARLIIIFHLVGAVGLANTLLRPLFLQLVPFHLLLMMLILFFNYDQPDKKLYYFLILTYITGFTVEWVGVHTSQIFGVYTYGSVLGLQTDGIPLIIGVNWFLLIYATGVSLKYIRIKNMVLRILIGALVLVLLDVLIEPVAIRFGYWQWDRGIIPDTNYISWYIISLVLLFVFELFDFKKPSLAAPVLLICQFIFFAALQ